MNKKSVPLLTPEDPATDRLVAAVESAIGGIQEHLSNLAADGQNAKWSVSDLVKLLQLRNQLQEQQPRDITVCWVDNPDDYRRNIGNDNIRNIRDNDNDNDCDDQ